jgi:hypothetical protein
MRRKALLRARNDRAIKQAVRRRRTRCPVRSDRHREGVLSLKAPNGAALKLEPERRIGSSSLPIESRPVAKHLTLRYWSQTRAGTPE